MPARQREKISPASSAGTWLCFMRSVHGAADSMEVSGIELGGGALRADQVASCVALLCFYTNAIRGKICSRTKALFNCGLVCTMSWSGPTLRRTAFVGQSTRWTPRADHSVGAPWLLSSRGAAKLILSTERIRVECRAATSLAEKVARPKYVGQLTCY